MTVKEYNPVRDRIIEAVTEQATKSDNSTGLGPLGTLLAIAGSLGLAAVLTSSDEQLNNEAIIIQHQPDYVDCEDLRHEVVGGWLGVPLDTSYLSIKYQVNGEWVEDVLALSIMPNIRTLAIHWPSKKLSEVDEGTVVGIANLGIYLENILGKKIEGEDPNRFQVIAQRIYEQLPKHFQPLLAPKPESLSTGPTIASNTKRPIYHDSMSFSLDGHYSYSVLCNDLINLSNTGLPRGQIKLMFPTDESDRGQENILLHQEHLAFALLERVCKQWKEQYRMDAQDAAPLVTALAHHIWNLLPSEWKSDTRTIPHEAKLTTDENGQFNWTFKPQSKDGSVWDLGGKAKKVNAPGRGEYNIEIDLNETPGNIRIRFVGISYIIATNKADLIHIFKHRFMYDWGSGLRLSEEEAKSVATWIAETIIATLPEDKMDTLYSKFKE